MLKEIVEHQSFYFKLKIKKFRNKMSKEDVQNYLASQNLPEFDFVSLTAKAISTKQTILEIPVALNLILEIMKENPKLSELELQDMLSVAKLPAFVKNYIIAEMININSENCSCHKECDDPKRNAKIAYIASVSAQYSVPSFSFIRDKFFSLETKGVSKMLSAVLLKAASIIVTPDVQPDNLFISGLIALAPGMDVIVLVINTEVNVFEVTTFNALNIDITTTGFLPPFGTTLLENLNFVATLVTASTNIPITIGGAAPITTAEPMLISDTVNPSIDLLVQNGSGGGYGGSTMPSGVVPSIAKTVAPSGVTLRGVATPSVSPIFVLEVNIAHNNPFAEFVYVLHTPITLSSIPNIILNGIVVVVDELAAIQLQSPGAVKPVAVAPQVETTSQLILTATANPIITQALGGEVW